MRGIGRSKREWFEKGLIMHVGGHSIPIKRLNWRELEEESNNFQSHLDSKFYETYHNLEIERHLKILDESKTL